MARRSILRYPESDKLQRLAEEFLRRGSIPEDVKLEDDLRRLFDMTFDLQMRFSVDQPGIQPLRAEIAQLRTELEEHRRTIQEERQKAQKAVSSYHRASAMQRRARRRQVQEAVRQYLEIRRQKLEWIEHVLSFVSALHQSLETYRTLPFYCPQCGTLVTPEARLAESMKLKDQEIFPNRPKELVQKILSTCPKCKGKLTRKPDAYLQDRQKLYQSTRFKVNILPPVPSRMNVRLVVFPPVFPEPQTALAQQFQKLVRRKMAELTQRIPTILTEYLQRHGKSPHQIDAYLQSLKIELSQDNVITVDIVKPLGRKMELGKERYPLWHVLKNFKTNKNEERYAIIPLQVEFEKAVQKIPGFFAKVAFLRQVEHIKKNVAITRVRFQRQTKKGTYVTAYQSVKETDVSPRTLGISPRKYPHSQSLGEMPRGEKAYQDLATRLRTKLPKPVSFLKVYRQATLRYDKRVGVYAEKESGLVTFRTLKEEDAYRSFIIPAVKPLYALEYLAQVCYQEIQNFLQQVSLQKEFKPYVYTALLPHEVGRLYGTQYATFGDVTSEAGELERTTGIKKLAMKIQRSYGAVGSAQRRSIGQLTSEDAVQKSYEHWYSTRLGVGKL